MDLSEEKEEEPKVYTINLRRVWVAPQRRRTERAVRALEEFVKKHVKAEKIRVDPSVNERLWGRGSREPPRKITVRVEKDEDDVAVIKLPEE